MAVDGCSIVIFDPFTGTLICEDSGLVIEERIPSMDIPAVRREDGKPVSSYSPMDRYFGLLQREVFRASNRLGLPSYVRETAMAIAERLENTKTIRRSRIPVYVAASIRVACEIHGLDIPISRILLASNSDGKRARHMLSCMETAWWAAEKIYPGARKRAKKHMRRMELEDRESIPRSMPLPA